MMTRSGKPRVWVTGSGGFLGRRLARRLEENGFPVLGFARRGAGEEGSTVLVDLGEAEAVTRLRDLARTGEAADVLVHVAARQPGSGGPASFVRDNVLAAANVLEALEDHPPAHVIYTSTQMVYDLPAPLPLDEAAPAQGQLPYGATKRWAELLFERFAAKTQVTVLRLPSIYGAGQADSFVDGLARSALRGEPIELFSRGGLLRDALHVGDVVQAILSCIEKPPEGPFTVMNLGCGRAIPAVEYAQRLVEALGSSSAVVPVDRQGRQADLYVDIGRARRQIGFEPSPLEKAMRVYADELRA